MEERHIELVWRCSSCKVQNLGRHIACTGCGNPKDDSEEYEMPADPSAVASVTDAGLLAIATGGESWCCRYCESHQRRADGACASCGASSEEGGATADAASTVASAPGDTTSAGGHAALPEPFWRGAGYEPPREPARFDYSDALDEDRSKPVGEGRARRILGAIALAVLLPAALLLLGVRYVKAPVPAVRRSLVTHVRVLDGNVSSRSWEHRVFVDRWKKVPHQGFAELRPTDAVDIVPLGQREHHKERVSAGFKTETYSERVSDGSTTETYTASESCGQTCTSKPKSCRQVCSSSKNGFAKCREECTGGGQTCTTKTCSVTKTRSVPRYKDVTRTRQVQQWRDEPRYATFYSWKLWQWVEDRRIIRKGGAEAPIWPEPSDLLPKEKLAEGERERDRRETSYALVVAPQGHAPLDVPVETLAAFERATKAGALPVWLAPSGDAGILALPPD